MGKKSDIPVEAKNPRGKVPLNGYGTKTMRLFLTLSLPHPDGVTLKSVAKKEKKALSALIRGLCLAYIYEYQGK